MKTKLLLVLGVVLSLATVHAEDNSLAAKATQPLDDAFSLQPQGVMKYDEGKEQPLAAAITLADGSLLQPSGEVSRPDGSKFRLQLGQVITRAGVVRKPGEVTTAAGTAAVQQP